MCLVAAQEYIYIGPAKSTWGGESVNTSEYALQMCRPVTLQVNTLADGQLRTGWPHRLPPGERSGEGRRRVEGKEESWSQLGGEAVEGECWMKEVRRGFCAEVPRQMQVTLRTCVAWQAGYRGDRKRQEREREREG